MTFWRGRRRGNATTRARAESGVGAVAIVRQTLRWASCCDDADEAEAVKATVRDEDLDRIEGTIVSAAVLLVRLVQSAVLAPQRHHNGLGSLIAVDALSVVCSVALFVMRVAVQPPEARHQDEAQLRAQLVLGGSPWLTDTVLVMATVSTMLPLYEEKASSQFVALGRVATLAVAVTQALPRLACSAAACAATSASGKFSTEFRALGRIAACVWIAQGLFTGWALGQQLIVPLAHESGRALDVPALLGVGATVAIAASIAAFVYLAHEAALRE